MPLILLAYSGSAHNEARAGASVHELTAINLYFINSKMCRDWGLHKLGDHFYEESIEEMNHADKLVERIIFLEGHPNLQTIAPLRIGQNVREVLEADLAGEYEAREAYGKSREICREHNDYVSMELFEELLADEEGHIDFLETQLDLIKTVGIENYAQLNAEAAEG